MFLETGSVLRKKGSRKVVNDQLNILMKVNKELLQRLTQETNLSTCHLVQFSLSLKKIYTFFSIVCLLCMKLLDNKSPHNRQQPLWIILIDDRWISDRFINKRRARAPCSPLTLNKGVFKSHCFIALAEEILLQPTGHTKFFMKIKISTFSKSLT
jgi:hypothetical protein